MTLLLGVETQHHPGTHIYPLHADNIHRPTVRHHKPFSLVLVTLTSWALSRAPTHSTNPRIANAAVAGAMLSVSDQFRVHCLSLQ